MPEQGPAAWTGPGRHHWEPILAPSAVGDQERAWWQAAVWAEQGQLCSLRLLLPPPPSHPCPSGSSSWSNLDAGEAHPG